MKQRQKFEKNKEKGYIALITILTVMAVSLAVALSVSYLSIGEAQISLSAKKGDEVRFFAEACAENGLLRFYRKPASYNGETLSIMGGSCTITVANLGGSYRLTAFAQKGNYAKTIEVRFNFPGKIELLSWKEI